MCLHIPKKYTTVFSLQRRLTRLIHHVQEIIIFSGKVRVAKLNTARWGHKRQSGQRFIQRNRSHFDLRPRCVLQLKTRPVSTDRGLK